MVRDIELLQHKSHIDVLVVLDINNSSFVQFQIWDFPGQIDFFDPTFDSENIFSGCGALIFVIDSQVSFIEVCECIVYHSASG